jgi:glucose-6-phosphate 1-epimerase
MQGPAGVVNDAAGLPKVALTAGDGARAEIYLYGAHVTSWTPANGAEQLYLSPQADFSPGVSIRGGVPVVFPQFSGMGPLPKHGFLRTLQWEYQGARESGGQATAEFAIEESEHTLALWPHRFRATLGVTAGGPQLTVTLGIENTDARPFAFTAALHTYFAVRDVGEVAVQGLAGLPFRDAADGYQDKVQADAELRFAGEVDRIYFNAPRQVTLAEPGRRLSVAAEAFPDIVVWNPGPAKGAALADVPPGGYRQFICIEAAIVGQPVELAPGASWQGSQILTR